MSNMSMKTQCGFIPSLVYPIYCHQCSVDSHTNNGAHLILLSGNSPDSSPAIKLQLLILFVSDEIY